MPLTLGGLGSGLDTEAIVSQLMGVERLGADRLATQRSGLSRSRVAWQALSTAFSALASKAAPLAGAAGAGVPAATSSAPAVLGATVAPGAPASTTTLRVQGLATAQQLATGGISSPDALVGAGVTEIGGPTGVTVSGAPAGGVVVTRGSTGAALLGARPVPTSYGPGSRTLSLQVDGGAATTITLQSSYDVLLGPAGTAEDVLADVRRQLPAGVTASLAPDNSLRLAHGSEGAGRSLQVSGGAASALGLPTALSAGTDGEVRLAGVVAALAPGGTATAGGLTVSAGTAVREGFHVSTDATATVQDLALALGAPGSPVSASLVDTGDGSANPFRMVVTSTTTGSAGAVQLRVGPPPGLPPLVEVRAGQDARLSLGAVDIRRSGNTVDGVVPGVTLSLLAAEPGNDVTVTVASDDAAVAEQVRGMVTGLSSVLTGLASSTTRAQGSTTPAALPGADARGLRSSVWSAVGSSADLGFKLERDGTYSFEEKALSAALASDREGTLARLSQVAERLQTFATAQTASTGVVSRGLSELSGKERQLDQRIAAADVRLDLVEARYRKQFTALETAISSLRGQSDWLAGQIAGLPTWGDR